MVEKEAKSLQSGPAEERPRKSEMNLVRCLECERQRRSNTFIAKQRNFLNLHVQFHLGEERNKVDNCGEFCEAEVFKQLWNRCFGEDFDLEPIFLERNQPEFQGNQAELEMDKSFQVDGSVLHERNQKSIGKEWNEKAGMQTNRQKQLVTSPEWLRLQIVREMKKRAATEDYSGKSTV